MLLKGSSHECNWVPDQGMVARDMELLAADSVAGLGKTKNLTPAKYSEDGAHSELMWRAFEGRGEEAGEVEHQTGMEAGEGKEELRETDRKAEAAAHPAGRKTAQDDLGRSDSEAHSTRPRDQC
ncbi:leucine-rich repeat extensin-like protein [Gracilaria domingensis]|nr:leucine-rich repeat extensin-like protein [Gracilaria domingensis]